MNPSTSKKPSRACALTALLILTASLTSCVSGPGVAPPYSPASQADYLYLQKGVAIPTKFGTYLPPQDEKFVAEQKYLALERECLDYQLALKALTAKTQLSKP